MVLYSSSQWKQFVFYIFRLRDFFKVNLSSQVFFFSSALMEVDVIIWNDWGPNLLCNLLGTLFYMFVEAGWWNERAHVISQFVLPFYPFEWVEVFHEHHLASQAVIALKRSIACGPNCIFYYFGAFNYPSAFQPLAAFSKRLLIEGRGTLQHIFLSSSVFFL